MSNRAVTISKFLSLVLRHKPERIGLRLDEAGWTGVDELLRDCHAHGFPLTREELKEVVRGSDKQRFSFSEDGASIRANQGHSVRVELGYAPATPPGVLYHGTAERFLASIKEKGLIKGARHHVHLSLDTETARAVGKRYGKPLVLKVSSEQMHADGYVFYQSANNVWLVEHVPAKYLEL